MKIGILSDSHGRTEPMKLAIALLKEKGAEFFIHCGDVGPAEMLDYLEGLPSAFVLGNTDLDRQNLRTMGVVLNVKCLMNGGVLDLDGKKVAVTHGDDPMKLAEYINSPDVDYLLVGHTHQAGERRQGRVRIINPGALHRVARKSVALLDTNTDNLEWFFVDD